MLNLSLEGAERFVSSHPDYFWDGWDVVHFKPRPGADVSPHGMFHNGRWGLATRTSPDSEGKYRIRVPRA